MAIDFGKILGASTMLLVVSLVFNLIIIGIQVLMSVLGYGAGAVGGSTVALAAGGIGMFVGLALSAISIIGNFVLIVYSGFSGAKKGLDLISCGLVGMLIYTVVGIITGGIQFVIGILGLGANVLTSGNAVTGALGGAVGAGIMGLGLICGFGLFIAGMVLNLVIGIIGGVIGGAK
jgi:hypothetical protein